MHGVSGHGYRSVASRAEVEVVRKRSRFIGIVTPAQSGEEAEAFLESLRKRFPDATHHCYAYRVERSSLVRMSDDGEPQGTAGRPILEVIERNELENTCVAVVRYFGGTLLGAGGLTRAYAAAATEGIAAAGIATYVPHALVRFELSYGDWGKVEANLAHLGAHPVDVAFGASVVVEAAVAEAKVGELRGFLRDATAGSAEPAVFDRRYLPLRG